MVVDDVRLSAAWIESRALDVSVAKDSDVADIAHRWESRIRASASASIRRTDRGVLVPAVPGAWRSHPLHPSKADAQAVELFVLFLILENFFFFFSNFFFFFFLFFFFFFFLCIVVFIYLFILACMHAAYLYWIA